MNNIFYKYCYYHRQGSSKLYIYYKCITKPQILLNAKNLNNT